MCIHLATICLPQRDGQTDRQTDRQTDKNAVSMSCVTVARVCSVTFKFLHKYKQSNQKKVRTKIIR